MLSTEKISGAFKAIVEEAEKLQNNPSAEEMNERIKMIIQIAKHQSDIRGAEKGCCCKGHS